MPFRRFVIWGVERLLEWHLAMLCLLAVRFLLPVHDESYVSLNAFVAGVRETWRAGVDDARFMTDAFMNGDRLLYGWKTYVATAYVIGVHIYLQSLYLFTSLLVRRVSDGRDTLFSIAAFLVSFVIFCALNLPSHDAGSLRLALCLLIGGLVVVGLSAEFGKALNEKPVPPRNMASRSKSSRSRPATAFSIGQPEVSAVPERDAGYSVFRRKALYFRE
ncbi:hypothetical protein AEAC466_18730 [Asticcacaulis sp. AC466]|uniref:hypothetical protein n=1 Tax=Asticcacaulis sp. AC466 TaxID=1282362 RepID=UPI0003C400C3|nr:hypothetical protein [Asticcacaulis sp. AC466]ESQ82173.1 hypothetical protein AEAC466_18730 [Asticcacaulis sp. AC466]